MYIVIKIKQGVILRIGEKSDAPKEVRIYNQERRAQFLLASLYQKMNKSEKFFDRVSNRSKKPFKKMEQTYSKTIENTKKQLDYKDIVLDYGCGTGAICNEVAGDVKAVHAMDITAGMIVVAKTEASARKIKNIHFEQSTIFDERYKPESFNVILAFNILHYIDDVPKVMQRINELLKPGGLFISATACLGEKRTFLGGLLFFLIKIGIVPNMKFFKISEIETLITNGDFRIIEKENISARLPNYFLVAKKEAS